MKAFAKTAIIIFLLVVCACNSQTHKQKSFAVMQTEVKQMMDSVSKDIYTTSPVKWLNYFEDITSFYMASEGKLVFPNYNAARIFINDTLVHAIQKCI